MIVFWDFAYYIYFWTTSGQTLGQALLGIQVITVDGELLTIGDAKWRVIGYWISALPLGLGFLWAIWDENGQGWHDKIAGTYVVRVTGEPAPPY